MYDRGSTAHRLHAALVEAFGAEPAWELTPNRSYGYYLRYDPSGIAMGQIRAVIEKTLDFQLGVILAPRGYDATWTTG